jgi:hypothetical protein
MGLRTMRGKGALSQIVVFHPDRMGHATNSSRKTDLHLQSKALLLQDH